jgi:transposase
MLYVLASGQAQTRQEVAQLLGVHRHTVGHGLARYAGGGMEAWLALYVPAGKPLSLPPEVLASIAQALQQPAGLASDEGLRQWVRQTHHREVHDHTLDSMVRTRCKTTLKVARPRHTKTP